MAGRLSPTLPHVSGETPTSYLSRLAALHRTGAAAFCRDLGLAYRGIARGAHEAICALAALAGEAAASLLNEAIHKHEDGSYELRGERLTKLSLRRARVMVCPSCLAADIDIMSAELPPEAAAFGRTIWSLDPIRSCLLHETTLVEVTRIQDGKDLNDFVANTGSALRNLPALVAKSRQCPPSDLEHYLVGRLDGDAPVHEFLDSLAWHAVADVCQVLGAVALHGRDVSVSAFDDDDWRAAGDAGFTIAMGDASAICELLAYLDRTYERSRASTEGPQALYGALYKWLAAVSEPDAFEPLSRIIREHVQTTQPVGPQDVILGKPVGKRVLHSIRSASLEFGVHPKRLRKILLAKGVVPAHLREATDEQTTFDAERHKVLLEKAAHAVSLAQTETYLNAGRVQAKLLMTAGFIKPFVVLEQTDVGGEFNFAVDELDAFIGKLTANALSVVDEDGSFDIPQAAKRAGCSAVDIVRLILERKLTWVGQKRGQKGYLSVRVRLAEIKRHVHGERPPGYTAREVEKELNATTKTVAALIANGHLSTYQAVNPINRCPLVLVRIESISAFKAAYVSLFELAAQRGMHFRALQASLERLGVTPTMKRADFFATFFKRTDIPSSI